MNEIVEFLKENPVQYVATVDKEGKPRVRPFQFMLDENGKLYFCTSNEKKVYKELSNAPYIEICTSSNKGEWIRISGKVTFSNDTDIKKYIIENNDLVKSIYKTPDNKVFEIFYIEEGQVTISDFSGNPPRIYNI